MLVTTKTNVQSHLAKGRITELSSPHGSECMRPLRGLGRHIRPQQ